MTVCGVVAIAAALIIGLWLDSRGRQSVEQPPPQTLEYAKVTRLSGSVELLSPLGELRPAKEGGDVPSGHTLRTVGEDSAARVELPDRTTVDIEPDSIVRFISLSDEASKPRLYLASGQLTAAIPEAISDRQLVVGTGLADVFARKGTFVVSSAGPDSLRVEIKHGKVDVVGTRNPTRVPVGKGAAVMRAGFENVFLEPVVRVDRTPTRTLPQANPRDAIFSRDGNEVLVAYPRHLTRWTRDGGTSDFVFPQRRGGYGPVALFTSDRGTLVTSTNPNKEEKARGDHVLLWKLAGTPSYRELDLRLPEPRLWTAAPEAAWLALADPKPNNKRIRIVEGSTAAVRFSRNFDETVGCLAASPSGTVLAVGLNDIGRGTNSKVALLDSDTGVRISTLPTQRKGASTMAFSADGRFLAVGFHGLVHIWDTQSRELVKSIAGFERVVTCLSFSRDGKLLAGGTQDGQVWVWSVSRGLPNQLIEVGSRGVRAVAFSPDGRRLVAVANNAPVGLWDVAEVASNGESE